MDLMEKLQKAQEEYEMKSKYNCPYCTEIVNLRFAKPIQDDHSNIILRSAKCPDCEKQIIEAGINETVLEPACYGRRINLKKKPIKYEIIYPKKKLTCINEEIPQDLRDILNEAYSTMDQSLTAAAALARKSLETFLVRYLKVSIEKKSLFDKIDAIKWPDYVNPQILHAIRMCGNYGLHIEKDAAVTKDEAEFVIFKAKELFGLHFLKSRIDESIMNQIKIKDSKSKNNKNA